ncbi:hypothetical protein WA158_003852 [Blastocystis sp. Blastoise]
MSIFRQATHLFKSDYLNEVSSMFVKNRLPCFQVNANNIKKETQTAKTRIYCSSLYLGNETQEKSFVSTLKEALYNTPSIKMNWILDGCRGTRGHGDSSLDLLLPLQQTFPNQFTMKYFYFPFYFSKTCSFLKKILPQKVLEIFNVYHIKIYIFDNKVILSGANLSKTYFTDRIDRYIMIESQQLVEYYIKVLNCISNASSSVDSHGKVTLNKPSTTFISLFKQACLLNSSNNHGNMNSTEATVDVTSINNSSTQVPATEIPPFVYLYPTFQLHPKPYNIDTDKHVLLSLLSLTNTYNNKQTFISSGYLNIPKYLTNCFTPKTQSETQVSFITSSPQANSFFQDPSYPSHIPLLYSHEEEVLFKRLTKQKINFKMYEYNHATWSFHAKGLWIQDILDKSKEMIATIGSPNFGQRSMTSDFETQLYMISENRDFISMMNNEIDDIFFSKDNQTLQSNTFQDPSRIPPASTIHHPLAIRFLAYLGKYTL